MSIDTVVENNATANEMSLIAGLWSQTAAITAIGFTPYVGSCAQYTTAYLYGVSNAYSNTNRNQLRDRRGVNY